MGELLEYCLNNKIKIGYFLHTFTTEFLEILNLGIMSKRKEKDTVYFLNMIRECVKANIFNDFDDVTTNFNEIKLYDDVGLNFLAPIGHDYLTISVERAEFKNGIKTSVPDFNKLSTVIQICKEDECVLLTSDAPRRAIRRIRYDFKKKIILAQVPHHGSNYNHSKRFWAEVDKVKNCPSVFSVGFVRKDKLPKKDVVESFELDGFINCSTNYVFGIEEFYPLAKSISSGLPISTINTISLMKLFSKSVTVTKPATINNRFNGDKNFSVF
jgi:hypothetical protein